MPRSPGKYNRRSIRIKDYDYSQAGAYFITICTRERENFLGIIADGSMKLSPFGEIVEVCWENLPYHYPYIILNDFVIMPNHVHGIIVLTDPPTRTGVS